MVEKLEQIKKRYDELGQQLSDPGVIHDYPKFRALAKERNRLEKIVEKYQRYKQVKKSLAEDEDLVKNSGDPELKEIALEELEELREAEEKLIKEMKLLLLPSHPDDPKDIIMEIRAGTGGGEAALFASDLYKMYAKYAENHGWKPEVLNSNPTGIGGFKEIIFSVKGEDVFRKLKFESGVHRVQRVPVTESSGRIHTSAASVAVLPEAEDIDIKINPEELRIDVFRSTGPGGQSVNTTDSAVRVTHLPSGLVVSCQDEKSQHKNKAKAFKVLRARLYDMKRREEEAKIAESRRLQVGSGDRSAKIRTYNFPQGRVTDHRINLTLYRLEEILAGELDELIEKLQLADQEDRMKEAFSPAWAVNSNNHQSGA